MSSEVEKLKAELDALRRELETAHAANHAKSDFLASISHEIRTPMNGVLGLTELMMGTPMSDKQQDFMDCIQNSADHIVTIISDILDFSKIEAGKLDIEYVSLDIVSLVQDSIEMLVRDAAKNGTTLKEEALNLGYLSEEEFDEWVDPAKMIGSLEN